MEDPKNRHLGTIAQVCRAVSSQPRHTSTIGKKLLNSNISSTCPHNMVNFGPLTAEIGPVVWGTPANFNGFRVLAALLHGSPVVDVSQTLRRWTEGTTYVRQGDHHVGHWPTFWYLLCFRLATSGALLSLLLSVQCNQSNDRSIRSIDRATDLSIKCFLP